MKKNPHSKLLLLRLVAYLMAVIVFVGVLFVSYIIVSPLFYSEERRAEVAAAHTANFESQIRDRAVEAVGGLYYVQDSRTGICFAIRSVNRIGQLAQVDCAAVPANMLLSTE